MVGLTCFVLCPAENASAIAWPLVRYCEGTDYFALSVYISPGRSRQELSTKYPFAKIGFDTAENEPPKSPCGGISTPTPAEGRFAQLVPLRLVLEARNVDQMLIFLQRLILSRGGRVHNSPRFVSYAAHMVASMSLDCTVGGVLSDLSQGDPQSR